MYFIYFFFFFNDTATTEIYTLSLHDALPISCRPAPAPRDRTPSPPAPERPRARRCDRRRPVRWRRPADRKSTRLNSSHANISYAVFCLKKKKKNTKSHIVYTVIHPILHHNLY